MPFFFFSSGIEIVLRGRVKNGKYMLTLYLYWQTCHSKNAFFFFSAGIEIVLRGRAKNGKYMLTLYLYWQTCHSKMPFFLVLELK